MIAKKILNPERIRRIEGGFGFIPHRLITDGFVAALDPHELLLYFFLILVADRNGLSYYAYDSICSFLSMSLDQYVQARNGLIDKDLIAFNGTLFQVLCLPVKAPEPRKRPVSKALLELIQKTVKGT
jgi:hypothetical protein